MPTVRSTLRISRKACLFPFLQQGPQVREQMAAVVIVQRFLFKGGVEPASVTLRRMKEEKSRCCAL